MKHQNRSGRWSNNSCYIPSLKLGWDKILFFFCMHSHFCHRGCVWVLSRNEWSDLTNVSLHTLHFSQDLPIRRIVGLQVFIYKLRDPVFKYVLLCVYNKEDKLRKISVPCIWMQFLVETSLKKNPNKILFNVSVLYFICGMKEKYSRSKFASFLHFISNYRLFKLVAV